MNHRRTNKELQQRSRLGTRRNSTCGGRGLGGWGVKGSNKFYSRETWLLIFVQLKITNIYSVRIASSSVKYRNKRSIITNPMMKQKLSGDRTQEHEKATNRTTMDPTTSYMVGCQPSGACCPLRYSHKYAQTDLGLRFPHVPRRSN